MTVVNVAAAKSASLLPTSVWSENAFVGHWQNLRQTADVTEPGSGLKLGRVGIANAADIAASCEIARKRQGNWADTAYEQRAAILRAAARVAEDNRAEIVDWIVRESGSIAPKAEFEVAICIKAMYEASAMPSQAHGQVLPTHPGQISIARRRPIGVVGVISPFNFPLYLAMRAVAPALALGNAVVLKPDPRTAISGGFVIARLFEQAGLPSGLLHVLPGAGDAGAALCTDPHVGMIQFTGSTSAGRKVGELAGRHLKKLSLELGGKNSLIVLDDADIDLAVKNTSWSAYLHQGQICMSAGRVLVQANIAERFAEALVKKAALMSVGNPTTGQVALGPLINAAQCANALRIVDDAVTRGASLLTGGTTTGLFFKPTVLSNVTKSMSAFNEEIFAPVVALTTFEHDDDAVALANDTEFGLSAAIITNNIGRALSMGEKLNVGLLHINDQTVNDDVINPFGGVGASGNGTSIGGSANFELFTHWQWMTIKGAPPAYPL